MNSCLLLYWRIAVNCPVLLPCGKLFYWWMYDKDNALIGKEHRIRTRNCYWNIKLELWNRYLKRDEIKISSSKMWNTNILRKKTQNPTGIVSRGCYHSIVAKTTRFLFLMPSQNALCVKWRFFQLSRWTSRKPLSLIIVIA